MTRKNTKAAEEFKKSAKKPAARMTAGKGKTPKKPTAKKPKKTKEEPQGIPCSFRRRGGCWGTGRGGMGW